MKTRKRRYEDTLLMDLDYLISDSKSKKLRKKKSKSKDKRELGVQLAVDSVRQYVKQHFRQYSYTEQETG